MSDSIRQRVERACEQLRVAGDLQAIRGRESAASMIEALEARLSVLRDTGDPAQVERLLAAIEEHLGQVFTDAEAYQ